MNYLIALFVALFSMPLSASKGAASAASSEPDVKRMERVEEIDVRKLDPVVQAIDRSTGTYIPIELLWIIGGYRNSFSDVLAGLGCMKDYAQAREYIRAVKAPDFNFNINMQDEQGETLLHHAVEKELVPVAQALVDSQAHLDTEDKHLRTPLCMTFKVSGNSPKLHATVHPQLACMLITAGALVATGDVWRGCTPCGVAATGSGLFLSRELLGLVPLIVESRCAYQMFNEARVDGSLQQESMVRLRELARKEEATAVSGLNYEQLYTAITNGCERYKKMYTKKIVPRQRLLHEALERAGVKPSEVPGNLGSVPFLIEDYLWNDSFSEDSLDDAQTAKDPQEVVRLFLEKRNKEKEQAERDKKSGCVVS